MVCSELNYKVANFNLIKTMFHFEEILIPKIEMNSSAQIFNKAK